MIVPGLNLTAAGGASRRRHASAPSSGGGVVAVEVAYCVVGQERGFTSPLVFESLRRNAIGALNASIASYLRLQAA